MNRYYIKYKRVIEEHYAINVEAPDADAAWRMVERGDTDTEQLLYDVVGDPELVSLTITYSPEDNAAYSRAAVVRDL